MTPPFPEKDWGLQLMKCLDEQGSGRLLPTFMHRLCSYSVMKCDV